MNVSRLAALAAMFLSALVLGSCTGGSRSVVFHAERVPSTLEEWNLLRLEEGRLFLNERVVPYELTASLFTDYAQKLRTIWMPEGTSATYSDEDLDYPVGTIISKTFYYPRHPENKNQLVKLGPRTDSITDGLDLGTVRLLETRLLVHKEDGWVAFPYVWNEEQTKATLEVAGEIFRLSLVPGDSGPDKERNAEQLNYIVPDANQCAGCHAPNHTEGTLWPIGPKPGRLNLDYPYGDGARNQLAEWSRLGLLAGLEDPVAAPKQVDWADSSQSVEDRARSYLEINCGHCHNPAGPADTSGLFLDLPTTDSRRLGVCKPPVAAGRGSGDRLVSIEPGSPEESIMVFRMGSTGPGEAMPELGRSSVHVEGVDLIRQWIAGLDEDCSKPHVSG